MRQCAVIGLGAFGRQVAKELSQLGVRRTIVRGESDVRRRHGVNIVAVKKSEAEEYDFPSPHYRFLPSDILLVTGGGEGWRTRRGFSVRSSPPTVTRRLAALTDRRPEWMGSFSGA